LFIDAANQVKIGRAQNYLEKENADQIYTWYSNFENVKNHAKIATLKDIADNDWNLNIPLYIDKTAKSPLPSVEEATLDLKHSLNEVWESEEKLKKLLHEFSLSSE
jgi:type I restriction enzyme M protein